MGYETIEVETADGITTLTLNRPAQLNALNHRMIQELDRALDEMAADNTARVLVLTGAGERAFAAGGDIHEFERMDHLTALAYGRNIQRVFRKLETLPKPSVAAVNGFALGGGCELMLACDIAYAADTARIGQPEVTLGIIPGAGGTQRLPRVVGKPKALELLMTGDTLTAAEALAIGLVCKVVPAANLMAEVEGLCRKLLARGAVALQMAKEAALAGMEVDMDSGLEFEAKSFAACFATEDRVEGVRAFLEKRKPAFKGR